MLYFHHFILHSDIRSIVIDKFSLCYFAIPTFVKLSFNKFYGICNNFTHNFSMKTCYFVPLHFHWIKNRLNASLTNKITLVKCLRSFEVQEMKWQLCKWVIDSAMILSQSLFHFYDIQLFYHSFIYVNVFSSCSDTLSHLIVSKKLCF